jgi:MSHA biogenesis protein MshM
MKQMLGHFGLREAPFSLTPDTAFAYAAPAHQDALATLLVALQQGEGFVKVTGEVGTGKTLLCRLLLDALSRDAEVVTAYVPRPMLTPRELLVVLTSDLGLRGTRRSATFDLHQGLESGLLALAESGRRVVICVDEAQALPLATLESLRLLSNLETCKRKLLQIVLFGQPELDQLLSRHDCRSLASRIGFTASLGPLGRPDLARYLRHRMAVAGWCGPDVFGPWTNLLLHRACRGVPRRANVLAHKCLMLAFGDGVRRVSIRHALEAMSDSRLPTYEPALVADRAAWRTVP